MVCPVVVRGFVWAYLLQVNIPVESPDGAHISDTSQSMFP